MVKRVLCREGGPEVLVGVPHKSAANGYGVHVQDESPPSKADKIAAAVGLREEQRYQRLKKVVLGDTDLINTSNILLTSLISI